MSDFNGIKCVVHGCNNRTNEGSFVGDLCRPCYNCITTGQIGPTTSFIGELERENARLKEELEEAESRGRFGQYPATPEHNWRQWTDYIYKKLETERAENARLKADLTEWMRCAEARLDEMQRLKAERDRFAKDVSDIAYQLSSAQLKWMQLETKVENQRKSLAYLQGATSHAGGTPLTKALKECEELKTERDKWRTRCEEFEALFSNFIVNPTANAETIAQLWVLINAVREDLK